MAKSRKEKPKQGPPVIFRPGSELGRLVEKFAAERSIGINEAYKELAALAVVGLDVRYHESLSQVATQMAGPNAFVRVVLQVRTALLAAALLDAKYAYDPVRTAFLIATLQQQLVREGQTLRPEIVDALLVRLGIRPATSNEPSEQTLDSAEVEREPKPQKIRLRVDGGESLE